VLFIQLFVHHQGIDIPQPLVVEGFWQHADGLKSMPFPEASSATIYPQLQTWAPSPG
jgi:hypothetical protein